MSQVSTYDADFESYANMNAGAADCEPIQGGSIKKGSYCMLKGNPCKVTETAISKPGKHGSAKISVTGVDIFLGKKHEEIFSTSENVWVPIVTKTEYEVADISDENYVSYINKDGELKEAKLPSDAELYKELSDCWFDNNEDAQVYFTMINACGQSKFIACRIKGT